VTILLALLVVAYVVVRVVRHRNKKRDAKRRSALALEVECRAREDDRRAARDAALRRVNPMHVCAPACGIGAAHYETSAPAPAPPVPALPKRSHHKKKRAKTS
jgi:hypothetical protein